MKAFFLFLIYSLLLAGGAHAVTVSDLYQARVPVNSRATGLPPEILQKALGQVLVKLSARPEAAALATTVPDPDRLLRGYDYQSLQDQLHVLVQFHEQPVRDLLAAHRLGAQSGERPLLLVWLALADQRQAHLLSEDSAPVQVMQLQNLAYERGLPLLFPLLDMDERQQVTAEQLRLVQLEPLQAVSQRYQPDGILSAYAFPLTGAWELRWQLQLGQRVANGRVRAADHATLFGAFLDQVLVHLAPPQTVPAVTQPTLPEPQSDSAETLIITIEGISSLAAYARLQKQLQEVPGLQALQLLGLDAQQVQLRVDLDGGEAALREILARRPILHPIAERRYRLAY